MIDDKEEFTLLVYTVTEITKADQLDVLTELLINSQITINQTDYDNWNGGTFGYTIYLAVDVKTFISMKDKIEEIETSILERFHVALVI